MIGGILYLTKKNEPCRNHICGWTFFYVFGFMFGSIFGFEDIIEPIWLQPAEAMTNLPFIGQLNTVFIVAVAFGMGLNILVMIFQIINSIKSGTKKNYGSRTTELPDLCFMDS